MITVFISGLIIGAMGSFHCLGMCGPLALSLPVVNDSDASRFTGSLLYNAGRVVTYTLLGACFGIIGNSIYLLGFQQALSIGLGILILMVIALPKSFNSTITLFPGTFRKLRKQIGILYQHRNYRSLFTIGLLNGLLPCGLVYMAVAGAVATASVAKSALFMAAFGLGTLPLMWALIFFGNKISFSLRITIRKSFPYIMFCMACLLILRGMELGVPYISPSFHGQELHFHTVSCHD